MKTLISPLLLVFFSLSAGYFFGNIYEKKALNIKKIRIFLQRTALLVLNPVAFLGAVWIAPVGNLRIITLPFVAAIAIITGGLMAFLYSRMSQLEPKQIGSLIPVCSFTNIGSIGGIVVFFLLGESAFSLVPIYKLFEELLYYGIGFPLAKSFSDLNKEKDNRLKYLVKDPFILTMLAAVTTGLILNFSGLNRPEWYTGLNGYLIPLATILLLFSIGMAIRFSKMKKYMKFGLVTVIIKTLIVPVTAMSFAVIFGLGDVENGLALKTVLVLSVMPAGFVSLVPPTIYDLDIDLSNTAWLASMASLIYVIPLLAWLIPMISV
jgi:predicted permease